MDDYPNSSETMDWNVEKPEERKEAEQKEDARVTSSVAVIREVIEWMSNQRERYSNVNTLNIAADTDPANLMGQVIAAQKITTDYDVMLASFKRDFARYLEPADEA